MANFDGFEERVADVPQPLYITVHVTQEGDDEEDQTVGIATNISDTNDIIRVLAQAVFEVASNPDWQQL